MPRTFALVLCLLMWGCSRSPESAPGSKKDEPLPDQVIWNGRIEINRGGKLESIIHAGQIASFKKETLLDSGVVVDFYNKKGLHASTLTSQRARVVEAQDLFYAEGNVVVTSDSGDVLRTERLFWDRKRQRIRSDTLVVMTTSYDSLRGYDFESNEDLRSWQLKKPTGQTFRKLKK